ncbi:MAG: YdcF family protein, partial [Chitinivibrionales bacterium]
GKAQVVVATGGAIPFLSGHSVYEAETMKGILTHSLGLPEDSVLTEVESKNTRDHPLFVKELFAERGIKKDIILVTSAMHMPRAVSAFRREGFTVYPAQTDYNSVEDPEMRLFLFLPSYTAFCNFHKAVHEYQGLTVYKIMGWI